MRVEEICERIEPLDETAMRAVRARQDSLTKPQGSLGRLEELSIQLAGITGRCPPPLPSRKAVIVFAGDHGVVEQGISAYPREVTAQMVGNFLNGGAAINVLARQAGARVTVVDAGIAGEIRAAPRLIVGKVAPGTADITQGAAMSIEQAHAALALGARVAEEEIERGLDMLACGDMGIGNTTPAAAITAVITGKPVREVTGRGTGVDDAVLARKVAVIEKTIAINCPDPKDGLDVLTKLGGFEIGAIAGAMLAAAAARVPVIVDGFIVTASALIACTMNPATQAYLIAGHRSAERGHDAALAYLNLKPLLDLQMRLGEGTGAVMAFHVIEAAARVIREMATFEEAEVSQRKQMDDP